ncbi:MAG TPA: cytochrome C oxidase subunit IV family protein [Blastocatellia bacterium]|nr:cytochrome C oxidase subunit IV family protein [Blastocatellia bacterium]
MTEKAEEHGHGATTSTFLWVWIALIAITFFEVFLAYKDIDKIVMVIVLMGGSIVKAALIMAYFMHLKFERLTLVLTLVPAMVVCLSLFAIFFPDSKRAHDLRAPVEQTLPEPAK